MAIAPTQKSKVAVTKPSPNLDWVSLGVSLLCRYWPKLFMRRSMSMSSPVRAPSIRDTTSSIMSPFMALEMPITQMHSPKARVMLEEILVEILPLNSRPIVPPIIMAAKFINAPVIIVFTF